MSDVLYEITRTRKQLSALPVRMGAMCWVYILGFYLYDTYTGNNSFFTGDSKLIISVFIGASVILFFVAWWQRKNPATYHALITTTRFKVDYPGSAQWSFDVDINDIKRFEHRNTLSHAGKGIPKVGILMNDGTFHQISLNYFNGTGKWSDLIDGGAVGDMCRAIQVVRPEVKYPKTTNMRVDGLLERDYED